MRDKMHFILSFPLCLLAACSSAPAKLSLLPLEDGSYRGVAIAASESQALNGSLGLATSTCLGLELRHVVADTQMRFRGPALRAAERRGLAAGLATYVSAPAFPSLDANDDYEIDIHFKCV
ncbi:MAG: hypothetical protein J0H72_04070 [Burkholderiales bacterium]|nr:hypothetical protein [Burkholderiales bacterium]